MGLNFSRCGLLTQARTLQRIAIRLHTVLRIGKLKRSMAIHTVIACMELEKERLNAARQRIVVRGSV